MVDIRPEGRTRRATSKKDRDNALQLHRAHAACLLFRAIEFHRASASRSVQDAVNSLVRSGPVATARPIRELMDWFAGAFEASWRCLLFHGATRQRGDRLPGWAGE